MSEIAKIPKDKVFQDNENRLMNKSLEIRESIIDAYLAEAKGPPTDNRDVRVINEVLNSMDALVLGKVDRRMKAEKSEDNSDMVAIVKEVLLRSKNDSLETKTEVNPVIDVDVTNIVAGEDKIEYEELSLDDFENIVEG